MIARAMLWIVLGTTLALTPTPGLAQKERPVELGAVLSSFLADSAARTRGLPWISGSALKARWQSAKPVANPDTYLKNKGLTLARTGTVLVTLGGGDPIEMTLQVLGTPDGIQRVSIGFAYDGNFDGDPRDRVEHALAEQGFMLLPLKCDRKTEGVMFGNVAHVAKAPGKTASALWQSWNCAGTGACGLTLTILYRKSDVAEVECASP